MALRHDGQRVEMSRLSAEDAVGVEAPGATEARVSECPICGGRGVTCIDDLCRGAGYCMHGDGNCPNRVDDMTCEWEDEDDDGYDDEPAGDDLDY